MLGRTHLPFGTAVGVATVGLGGAGLGSDPRWTYIALHWANLQSLPVANLRPVEWPAIGLAAALGSLLPDIDQPGSLVTTIPTRQANHLGELARRHGRGPFGLALRLLASVFGLAGSLSAALLGGMRLGAAPRVLAWLLALLCAAGFAVFRWLPPPAILALPIESRQLLAFALGTVTAGGILIGLGGISRIVNGLPGGHRGWTHAPPLAIALTAGSLALAPYLLPNLRGVGAAFAAGYLSHLAADALTIRGIPLWWPGNGNPSLHLLPRGLRVRTGGAGERFFNICWIASIPILLVARAR